MAKNVEHVSHIKSKLKTNGLPQLPSPDKLVDGEIAINYAKGVETISIKNESGSIVTFSSDNYYAEKKLGSGFTNNDVTVTEAIDDLEYMVVNKEEAIAAALNDLNGRKLDASAYTPTDLSNYYTKNETSGKTEISNALGGKVSTGTYTRHTADTSLHFSGNEKRNLDALATNIESISGITSNDIANWNAAAAGVDMTKYYQKTETSGSTELSTAFSNKADSSALTTHTSDTTIHITSAERTAWNAKANMSDIPSVNGYADSVQYNSTTKKVEFYHGTTAGTKVFEYDASPFLIDGMVQNVEIKDVQSGDPAVTVTCLVVSFNTDAGKQDINIPISQIFDANNYYTTAQTSGATELQTAFNGKTDTATTTALNNVVTAHTANTNIHLTTTEKGQLHTHTNKTYLDSITGTVGTMVYENASSYSSATQVSTALADKVDKTEYATFSAATNTSIEDLSGQSETVAATLNDLNAKKLDTTAYTPVDTSLYYKKTETSGATEIQTALNGKVDITAFTSHTGSSVHMTTTEKTNLDSLATNIAAISGITATKVSNWDDANTKKHTHSNKTALDSITGNVGTMAYEDKTSYSSATDVNTALSNKADKTAVDDLSGQSKTVAAALVDLNTTITAHTASTVHMNDTEKTNLDSLATNIETISGITSTDKLIHDTINRRTRTDFTSKGFEWFKNTLKSAIADKSLEKYGLKVGDYYTVTHNGKTYNYVIAGLNTMKGTDSYKLTVDHVGIIVDTKDTHAWNTSNSTSTSQNTHSIDGTWTTGASAAGYASCDLQYYLEDTVLPNVETDLGSDNIKSHYKLYSNAIDTSGYNRFGSAGGCSSSWGWYANQKICALSEVQVYGSIVWSSSGYDTGEACRQLDVFRVYNMNEIFEGRYPWLRDVASSSYACVVNSIGCAHFNYAVANRYVAALILFA